MLFRTISSALGLLRQGTLAAEPRSLSLGDGLACLRASINLPQGAPGNHFWAKSKVRELRIKWPMALTGSVGGESVGREGVWKQRRGQEGETKSTETFLACQEAEISVCLCGRSTPDLHFP